MWTDNTNHAKIKEEGQIVVFKILNGYENNDSNICLGIHLVTLFNLPCIHILVME